MAIHTHIPTGPLASIVECFWLDEPAPGSIVAPPASGGVAHERVLPDGTASLVIGLEREPHVVVYDLKLGRRSEPWAILCGPHDRWFGIDESRGADVLGVYFKPGGAWAIFGVPAAAMRNDHIALDNLLGFGTAADLRDRLLDRAATPSAKFSLVEDWLLARFRTGRHPAIGEAVRRLERAEGSLRVRTLAADLGLSERRLSGLFRDEVGLTPKQYQRVRRFKAVVDAARAGRPIDWACVARDTGYADQAHMIRDVREHCGVTPGQLPAHFDGRTGHLLVDPRAPGDDAGPR